MNKPETRSALPQQLVLALQWVVFHAGIVISGPVILGRALQLSPEQTGDLIRLTLVLTGVGNILQATLGHRQNLLEGPAVPWLSGYLAVIGIAVSAGTAMQIVRTNIQGAMIVAGAVLLVAGLLGVIRRLRFLFTTRITGVLLTLIAIQISSVGVRGLIRNGPAMFGVGAGVLIISLLLLTRTKGILRNSALLLAVIVGWVISGILGLAPGAASQGAPLFALPSVFPWGAPTFDLGAIASLTILGLLMIPNLVGAVKAMEHATGQEVAPREYDRGLAVSGVGCGLAGMAGGIGTIPFAVSVGLVSVTGERTNRAYLMGAGLFILIGIVPPLGHFFSSIPEAIASAVMLISVSSLGVIGLQSATRESLDIRGSFVVGIGLLIGGGVMFVPGEFWGGIPYWLSSVLSNGAITGTIVAILLEQTILRQPKKEVG